MEATKDTTATNLGYLLDAGDGAVVTLIAGDTRLVAQRAVLTDRSPVFDAMFRHDMVEASRGEVSIPDVEGPVLRLLLSFLYTLQVPQLLCVVPQLLAAADKYGVSALKDACEQQVGAQLSVETAAAAAVLAIRHSCSGLREAAIDFIKTHTHQVMATQGWADAVRSQHEDVIELSQLLSETTTPLPEDSGTCLSPDTQPPSDRSQTPATAACSHTPPTDHNAVSRLRTLSAQEKGNRLIEAAKQGSVEELEALLVAGTDVGARDGWRWTALHWAAARGHVEAARRLLAAGAAVDARERWRWTPLLCAAHGGHAAVVRLLLVARADHGARSMHGSTPLHWAAANGHTEAAAALLEAGANRAVRTKDGQTPLDLAREKNHHQLVELLQLR